MEAGSIAKKVRICAYNSRTLASEFSIEDDHASKKDEETKTPARKLLEAFWINAKNPKMNSRDECPEVIGDLTPYVRINLMWHGAVVNHMRL
ncbi:unnamed protein product [Angiostrongylus costaricensis]|uniref:COesterase domain-containing protein n=1 Tax=Angiostrongylus costaricensis TaxID=334426 RepID=A0A0R3PM37_ANGCS|nr:unnamed protein product [Angiostrongylus costaricensis]